MGANLTSQQWDSVAKLNRGLGCTDDGHPRSRVLGLTPSQVRLRVLENGYQPLPVMRHDSGSKVAGKATLIPKWTRFAQFDSPQPTMREVLVWERDAASPGTGLACGAIVAIDLDYGS